MKNFIFYLIASLLSSNTWSANMQAMLFINSSDPQQVSLVERINQSLFYSISLRNAINVQVFDINSKAHHFSGEIDYHKDEDGKAVAQYRPGQLPYVFCQFKGKTQSHFTVRYKDQICLCIENC